MAQGAEKGIVAKVTVDIIAQMAEKFSLDRDSFMATMRKSIIAPKKVRDGNREYFVEASNEEVITFLQVAKQYDLNPFIKEVVAFVSKRGAVVPYVTIDGWITLINRNKRFGGLKALPQYDSAGKLFAYTVVGRVKDKDMPTGYYEVEITELLKECKRNTGPWDETEARMLRHKAVIQWGRYAFGYGGLYDQDEAEKIAESEAIDVTPSGTTAITGNMMPKALETVPPPPAAAAPKPARTEAPAAAEKPKETAPVATPAPSVGQAIADEMKKIIEQANEREPGADEDELPFDETPQPAGPVPIAERKKSDAMSDDEKRAEILQNAIDYSGSDDPGHIQSAVETFSRFTADGNEYKQADVKKLKGKWLLTTLGRSRRALEEQQKANQ